MYVVLTVRAALVVVTAPYASNTKNVNNSNKHIMHFVVATQVVPCNFKTFHSRNQGHAICHLGYYQQAMTLKGLNTRDLKHAVGGIEFDLYIHANNDALIRLRALSGIA